MTRTERAILALLLVIACALATTPAARAADDGKIQPITGTVVRTADNTPTTTASQSSRRNYTGIAIVTAIAIGAGVAIYLDQRRTVAIAPSVSDRAVGIALVAGW